VFSHVASYGNLDTMKWLFENKFSYDNRMFCFAILCGKIENIKWLLENKSLYNAINLILIQMKIIKIYLDWLEKIYI